MSNDKPVTQAAVDRQAKVTKARPVDPEVVDRVMEILSKKGK